MPNPVTERLGFGICDLISTSLTFFNSSINLPLFMFLPAGSFALKV